jgi:DNA-binding winged helix-turn-helix (wHTH) protein
MGTKSFVFRFDDVEVREKEFTVVKAGKLLTVEPKAFRALLFLLRNPQKLISKEELLNSVWGDAAVTEGSLTRCIWLLRSLLGDDTRNPRYIETVATVGYRFACKVEVAEDNSANLEEVSEQDGQGSRDSGDPQSRKQNGWSHGRGLNWLLPVGAVLVVGLAAAIWYFHRPLPPPHISRYSQITHDGHRKYIAGTDGNRPYFNFMSPISKQLHQRSCAENGALMGEMKRAIAREA